LEATLNSRTKVLIVDDSALARQVLSEVLASDPAIEVVGTANDPFMAAERMRSVIPDVLVLDIEMPRMDGITFLRKLMAQHPIPTVICSSLAEVGSPTALAALEAGAVEIIVKPEVGKTEFFHEARERICETVKGAASARVRARRTVATPKLSADAVLKAPAKAAGGAMIRTTEKVVVIGASTGGTEALRVLLEALPLDCPGLVIVQHMPEGFTATFAKRLDALCRISVREASDGDVVLRGQALIAPGNRHTLLRRSGAKYYVEVTSGPLVNRHRPAVDVLFRSAAQSAGRNAVGVILTGMGDDGARGMKELRDAGAATLAQDEATCVVYGMPAEAVRHGGVVQSLPLEAIAPAALRLCG
jgi:two-component system chemotaxis response regulator CheB